jgi:hypothetical protein
MARLTRRRVVRPRPLVGRKQHRLCLPRVGESRRVLAPQRSAPKLLLGLRSQQIKPVPIKPKLDANTSSLP